MGWPIRGWGFAIDSLALCSRLLRCRCRRTDCSSGESLGEDVRLWNSLNISSVLVAFYTFVCLPLDTLHNIFILTHYTDVYYLCKYTLFITERNGVVYPFYVRAALSRQS